MENVFDVCDVISAAFKLLFWSEIARVPRFVPTHCDLFSPLVRDVWFSTDSNVF